MAKRLRKKEILFIEKRLQELDLEVMEAFVIKEVENVDSIYLAILKDKLCGSTSGLGLIPEYGSC